MKQSEVSQSAHGHFRGHLRGTFLRGSFRGKSWKEQAVGTCVYLTSVSTRTTLTRTMPIVQRLCISRKRLLLQRFGCRSGVFLGPGLARCWERGGSIRYDSLGGHSSSVLVPCAGRGLRGRVLALFSFYAPVSGSAFDNERRTSLNELSDLLASFPSPLCADFRQGFQC